MTRTSSGMKSRASDHATHVDVEKEILLNLEIRVFNYLPSSVPIFHRKLHLLSPLTSAPTSTSSAKSPLYHKHHTTSVKMVQMYTVAGRQVGSHVVRSSATSLVSEAKETARSILAQFSMRVKAPPYTAQEARRTGSSSK